MSLVLILAASSRTFVADSSSSFLVSVVFLAALIAPSRVVSHAGLSITSIHFLSACICTSRFLISSPTACCKSAPRIETVPLMYSPLVLACLKLKCSLSTVVYRYKRDHCMPFIPLTSANSIRSSPLVTSTAHSIISFNSLSLRSFFCKL